MTEEGTHEIWDGKITLPWLGITINLKGFAQCVPWKAVATSVLTVGAVLAGLFLYNCYSPGTLIHALGGLTAAEIEGNKKVAGFTLIAGGVVQDVRGHPSIVTRFGAHAFDAEVPPLNPQTNNEWHVKFTPPLPKAPFVIVGPWNYPNEAASATLETMPDVNGFIVYTAKGNTSSNNVSFWFLAIDTP